MTTKRLAILLAVLLGGMGSVAFLPKQLGYQPVGINLDLPLSIGDWWGRDVEVTEEERNTLGFDTEFARKTYGNAHGSQILASIVLAGQDMMTSIHRPERCLNAQGWTEGDSSTVYIDIPGIGQMRATRLQNSKKVHKGDTVFRVNNLCYYWFVGYTDTAASISAGFGSIHATAFSRDTISVGR